MHSNYSAAVETAADARNRAWRTFVQGVAVDVAVSVLGVLVVLSVDTIEWTGTYWLAIASLVARSAIVALVAAVARRVVPPRV